MKGNKQKIRLAMTSKKKSTSIKFGKHVTFLNCILFYSDKWCFVLKEFKQSDVFFFVDNVQDFICKIEKDVRKKKKKWIPDWRHILTLNTLIITSIKKYARQKDCDSYGYRSTTFDRM